jgi:hypothetical protein|tara:strand:- start:87 stop:242 length:156 start_codon:yes stop_codon:yes gene_type:complete
MGIKNGVGYNTIRNSVFASRRITEKCHRRIDEMVDVDLERIVVEKEDTISS